MYAKIFWICSITLHRQVSVRFLFSHLLLLSMEFHSVVFLVMFYLLFDCHIFSDHWSICWWCYAFLLLLMKYVNVSVLRNLNSVKSYFLDNFLQFMQEEIKVLFCGLNILVQQNVWQLDFLSAYIKPTVKIWSYFWWWFITVATCNLICPYVSTTFLDHPQLV